MPRPAVVHPPAAVASGELLHADLAAQGGEVVVFDKRGDSPHRIQQTWTQVNKSILPSSM